MRRGRKTAAVLFFAYLACYAAFVGVAAFGTFSGGKAEGGLAREAAAGLPWGVVAGFGLIVGAFVMALLYALRASDAAENESA